VNIIGLGPPFQLYRTWAFRHVIGPTWLNLSSLKTKIRGIGILVIELPMKMRILFFVFLKHELRHTNVIIGDNVNDL